MREPATATVVIPARLGGKRLPDKVLLDDTGRPLIWYAIAEARRCQFVRHIIVATDSMRVANAVSGAAVVWVDYEDDSWCGSQRVARALLKLPERYSHTDVIVNWQADEPELQAEDVDRLIQYADQRAGHSCDFVTISGPYNSRATRDPTVVKAEHTERDSPKVSDFVRLAPEHATYRPHVGAYAFRPDRMADLATLTPTTRSIAESLEQLTWIDNDWLCEAIPIHYTPNSINSPQDYRRFVLDHQGDSL